MTQNMDMTAMAKVFISNSFKPCFFVVSSSPEYRPTNNAVINQKLVEARILFEGSFSATTVLMVLIKLLHTMQGKFQDTNKKLNKNRSIFLKRSIQKWHQTAYSDCLKKIFITKFHSIL